MGREHDRGQPRMNLLGQHEPLIIVLFLFFCIFTALSNARSVRRFDEFRWTGRLPQVSILVPARNEERSIGACVQSLLDQDYPDFEVIVLDDRSSDDTGPLLRQMARRNPRLQVVDGELLPEGWYGKHWACHQLAQRASGELLLFTDADTRHHPRALIDSVQALEAQQADLVTGFPHEEIISWGEKLVLPVIGMGIFSFIPLWLLNRLPLPGLSVTIGQFMLFRRTAFEAVGGYLAVRNHAVDDVALGRLVIEHGFRWRLMDATEHVSCRMYRGFREVVEGFSKNIYAFFDNRMLIFLVAEFLLATIFIKPVLVLAADYYGLKLFAYPTGLALFAVFQSLLLWGIAYRRFRFPVYLVLFYPLSMSLFLLIGMRSMLLTISGRATWKGRTMIAPERRWL